MTPLTDRRNFLRTASMFGGALAIPAMPAMPAWARSGTHGLGSAIDVLTGNDIKLSIGHAPLRVGGRTSHAIAVNGTVPGPLIRLKEGQDVRISVTNTLAEDSSIHWHGLLLPFQYDGVPGVSFPGIKPGETFVYEFPIRQSGTYWYHSHSGLQEAMGHFGSMVIDPAGIDRVGFDREHVLVLSDWSAMHPHAILKKLKQNGGNFNFQKQTLGGLLTGKDQSAAERRMWGKMRMDPTDISDVTGAIYTYLVNGHGPDENWTGLFAPGERVRLRIVNAAAMTNFNVRLPGLAMTIVAADGNLVRPVETDEFQIGVAETYDVIVRPAEDRAYGFIAESIDRSGMVRATLAPRLGMVAPVPERRPRPLLTMKDMGMEMAGHDMAGMSHDMGSMKMPDPSVAPQVRMGPGVATLAAMPMDRTAERPTGLEDVPHRVLTYSQLRSLDPNPDPRNPSREIDIHLTANMERYMWSFDGVKFSEGAEPLAFRHNERVRVNLINDTMMPHPIHLHGHFFEVVMGEKGHRPVKHTVNVLPGGKVAFDLTADALGDWAFHCHMMLHMHAGMFRVVTVRADEDAA
ncbi:copper-binding protein [Polymorphobacter glacialis]|uniref:Copper-binding protein n=1 Tax=Sandarakinorhabdus glacialis TaxID=1614636 RepID=A0A917A0C9_9SPHN|nr:copper resistance system multicopper oxidase [Polymorphobacter glacialis]GGE20940.1 copper-binding protein [Polymorphobacter glacialis]